MPASKRYALVLAAGFGSRMGPLGRELPKPLWPIFGTTILGHLIKQLEDLGFEQIFVNAHHQSTKVEEYINCNFPRVKVLVEHPLLDSAGCIVNCAKHINSLDGELFTFNGDNLIDLTSFDSTPLDHEIALYSEEVGRESRYNKLRLEEGFLREIMKPDHPSHAQSSITYAGISRIKLSSKKLRQKTAPLAIFKDFLNLREDDVFILPFAGLQVDLGTFELYTRNVRELTLKTHAESSHWRDFLIRYCGLRLEMIENQGDCYNAPNAKSVLNFSDMTYEGREKDLILFSNLSSDQGEGVRPKNSIYWSGKFYSTI